MTESRDKYLLEKYCVPSMGSYSQPGSELCEILHRLDENQCLDDADKKWIKSKGMFQIFEFIKNWEETGKPNFKPLRGRKKAKNEADKAIHIGEKYGIYIRSSKSILYKILQRIEDGKRFSKKDSIWLLGKGYLEGKLKSEYHRREAEFYLKQHKKDKSLWNIVNASSHFRKAHLSSKAVKLTEGINLNKINNKNLKSALSVTRGGAFRDLQQLDESLKYAQKGYSFDPSSYHPCTLFGAVYYEMGKYSLGDKWFTKAIENGAEINSIDSELRTIFKRAKGKEREELKKHLSRMGYCWANKT